MLNAKERFRRWYVIPIEHLLEEMSPDSGFIVLAMSCILYERYAKAQPKEPQQALQFDFEIDADTANTFWNIMRNGLAHQAMPKQKERNEDLPGWTISNEYGKPIELIRCQDNSRRLRVNPSKVARKVLELWDKNPASIDVSKSFPFADVFEDENC